MTGDNFLIVNNHVNKKGDVTTEFKEYDGNILVKHFSGINSENFVVKKPDGKRLEFSFFRIGGVYYVNLNGHHIIDYKKFIKIQSISNLSVGPVEQNGPEGTDVKIRNVYVGEIVLKNCDVEIVQKSLQVMSKWIKKQTWWLNDLMYYIFH